MKTHKKFMEEIIKANSLPAQTKKALAPESEEDKKMYNSENINKASLEVEDGS